MLQRLYGWYGKRTVKSVALIVVVLLITGVVVKSQFNPRVEEVETPTKVPVVSLGRVDTIVGASSFRVVGTVRSVSEARLETESGGRITAVNVKLGDRVAAGTVIATLENESQRAALLQAEAAKEAAEAGTLQSTSGLEEARQGVRNAYRNAYTVVDNVTRLTIDEFFANPSEVIIGFRLGGGLTAEMNMTRRELETTLREWSAVISGGYVNQTEVELLETAQKNLVTVSNFVIALSSILLKEDRRSTFSDPSYQASLTSARSALDGALGALANARRTYEQASLTVSTTQSSQASAQLKSALATVRAAEVNYEKTIVRSPIAGTVNAIYLKAGEYTTPGQPAVVIANNGTLEVSVQLGESDLAHVSVGDRVTLGDALIGVVTQVAPALDPINGTAEVKIAVTLTTNALKNGSTIGVIFTRVTDAPTLSSAITLPLSAVKLLPSGPIVFTVDENFVLVAKLVTLGELFGETVAVTDGLSRDDSIVLDVRGLKAGDTVVVTEN